LRVGAERGDDRAVARQQRGDDRRLRRARLESLDIDDVAARAGAADHQRATVLIRHRRATVALLGHERHRRELDEPRQKQVR